MVSDNQKHNQWERRRNNECVCVCAIAREYETIRRDRAQKNKGNTPCKLPYYNSFKFDTPIGCFCSCVRM